MNTDRELLTLAAKACGLPESGWMGPEFTYVKDDQLVVWNPLIDEGDALRLACKLHINVFIYHDETSTATAGISAKNWGSVEANTCRAIVCAAAKIGRQME